MDERFPDRRAVAVALVAFALGAAAGVGVAEWRQSAPEPAPFRADEHAVELVLFRAVPTRRSARPGPELDPLHVEGALLLSGLVTSTVVDITAAGSGLDVRIPALPVTVTPTVRLQEVVLVVAVRDCEAAVRWVAEDRPFVITWRDEYGRGHLDRAGDHGPSTADAFTRYIDAACEDLARSE